jgi:hypothetical protein
MPTHHLAGHEKQTRPFVPIFARQSVHFARSVDRRRGLLSSWRWRSLDLKGDLDSGEVVADRGGINAAFLGVFGAGDGEDFQRLSRSTHPAGSRSRG